MTWTRTVEPSITQTEGITMPQRFRRRQKLALIAAACAAGGLLSAVPLLSAPAGAADRTEIGGPSGQGNVAVVTPLLNVFTAGTSVGLPEACNVALGVLASGSAQLGVSAPAAPVISQISSMCANAASQGAAGLQTMNDQLAALAIINPAANQSIDTFANVLGSVAAMGPAFGPLGADLATLPAAVQFFKSH
jgi:hypothetical protein